MVRSNPPPAAALALLAGMLTTLPAATDAFVAPSPISMEISETYVLRQDAMVLMASTRNLGSNVDSTSKTPGTDVSILGALGLAAAILTSGGTSAVATTADATHVPSATTTSTILNTQSSTIQLSEAIKTMDFSLPSSYDTISDAKSAATDELTVTVNAPTGGGGKKAPKTKSSGGGGSSKQPAVTSEERAALKAAREAQKEADAAAKAAARAAAAEKAEAKKAATVSSGVEFVDMGLPSYSDSAKTEGKKSVFSL